MSVERFNFIRNGDCDGGEVCTMEQSIHGDYVEYTDYARDCIKGRCGGCKFSRDEFKSDKQVECFLIGERCIIPKPLDGYCDEFEPRSDK